jgi:predicted O-methyltransferase YrrM
MNVREVGVLNEMLTTGQVRDEAGQTYPLHSGIELRYAQVLHDLVLRERPAVVLELGLAYGVSTLAILSALAPTGGKLISIDPFQTDAWHGIGLANVRRAGYADAHTLIEQPDYYALPDLSRQGLQIDLAYLDGGHAFEYVLLDFFFVDRMLDVGRVIGFNDCIFPAIHRTLRFVKSHRHYTEIDVGLPKDYSGRFGVLSQIVRRFEDRIPADRYFRKLSTWEPNWDQSPRF